MDYRQLAEECITIADKKPLTPAEGATVAAIEAIAYAVLHLAEAVGRLEQ